jgi:AraC-like DNA-binding protein
MSTEFLIKHPSLISMIRCAQSHGAAENELFDILGTQTGQLDLSALGLAPEKVLDLVFLLEKLTGNQSVGLCASDYLKMADLGMLGHILMSCQTLEQAMEKSKIFYSLTGNVTDLTIDIQPERVLYCWKPIKLISKKLEKAMMEFLIAGLLKTCSELTGQDMTYLEVHLNWPAPENLTDYQQRFGSATICFNQSLTMISYDSNILQLPIKTANSSLLTQFEGFARETCLNQMNRNRLSDRVTRLLSGRVACLPRLKTVAEEFEMSSRSFQLRLKEEGTTYLKLRDTVRYELARNALESKNLSAAEIGEQLGFSEPSAFYRTFKRWSGMTPSSFRTEAKGINPKIRENH